MSPYDGVGVYAQLEVRCGDQHNEAIKRIAMHLDEIASHLSGLTSILQSADVAASETGAKKWHIA
jgi:hypothetical protein